MDFRSYNTTFTVPDRYTEGHALSAKEADALNRLRTEFISHKVRAKAFSGLKAGDTPNEKQIAKAHQIIAEQSESFEFGAIRQGSGEPRVTLDPVEKEAKAIATQQMKALVAKNGLKLQTAKQAAADELPEGTYARARFDEKVEELRNHPNVVAKAKKVVAARNKTSEGDEDGIEL